MNSTLSSNLKLLEERFPSLAEKLFNSPLGEVMTTTAKDGGLCYVKKRNDGRWHALSNNIDPILKAQQSVTSLESRIGKGLAPAVIIGLNPGYTLEILFKHFKDNYYDKYIPRRIYVIVDSLDCLCGWLQDGDKSAILKQTEIEFYWHQEVKRIVRQCKKDEQRSHLFIPISTLPEPVSMKVIEPLAEFFISRQEEEKELYLENCKYYEKQSDDELDKIITGKAGRKPRLLIPSHASSTVVQYSVRDTKAMFEKEGWEVSVMHMKTDLSRWRINKNINDFKPDIYLQVNHLRTEDTDFYPPEMMYITWVQDTVSYINNSVNARSWNEHVKSKQKRRDLIIGYVGQVKQYGYQEDRLSECPMIVNQDIFKARELSADEKEKYECDICFASNRSKETSLIVKEDLAPKLEEYGFTENLLMAIHDHLWEYYRDEKTCVGYIQLEDKIIELPEACSLIEKLINKDDHDFVIQRIYWELNDVIYRHVVLEWIDEMGDKKLHLYGRGWEDHPRFSKYAKGILEHGEELALAYQSAKQCLHLNSLEGDHQRLNEIIDAKGNPLTRLNPEYLDRQKQILEGFKNFNKPNIHFINNLWNTSKRVLDTFPKSQFHVKLNDTLEKQIQKTIVRLRQKEISFFNKNSFVNCSSLSEYESKVSGESSKLYLNLITSFINKKERKLKEFITLEISTFLFKLLVGKVRGSLEKSSAIETNLLCKIIQLTAQEQRKPTFKSLKKNIHFDHIIPEFIPNYFDWTLTTGQEEGIEHLISKAYERHKDVSDLYYMLAVKNYKNDKTWYEKARKDIKESRLTIQAAGQLTTLSVKWADELEVINNLLENVHKLKCNKEPLVIDLVPIFSQAIKVLGPKFVNKFYAAFKTSVSCNLINLTKHIALLENNLKSEIKVSEDCTSINIYSLLLNDKISKANLIFNKDLHSKDLLKLASSSHQRGLTDNALKVYKYLNDNNLPLNQSQANILISQSKNLNMPKILELIQNIYQNNPKLKNLYSNYCHEKSLSKKMLIKYSLLDLQQSGLSLNKVVSLSQLSREENCEQGSSKIIFDSFHKVKITENLALAKLFLLLDMFYRYEGAEQLQTLSAKKPFHKLLHFCIKLTLFKNNYPVKIELPLSLLDKCTETKFILDKICESKNLVFNKEDENLFSKLPYDHLECIAKTFLKSGQGEIATIIFFQLATLEKLSENNFPSLMHIIRVHGTRKLAEKTLNLWAKANRLSNEEFVYYKAFFILNYYNESQLAFDTISTTSDTKDKFFEFAKVIILFNTKKYKLAYTTLRNLCDSSTGWGYHVTYIRMSQILKSKEVRVCEHPKNKKIDLFSYLSKVSTKKDLDVERFLQSLQTFPNWTNYPVWLILDALQASQDLKTKARLKKELIKSPLISISLKSKIDKSKTNTSISSVVKKALYPFLSESSFEHLAFNHSSINNITI